MSRSTTLLPVPKVAATCRQLVAQPGLPFAEHLPAKLVHTTFRDLGHVFRQRIFTPAVTLWTFLSQVLDPDHSCRQAVARLLAHRVVLGLRPCSADTGAYCKARARLPEDGLAELTRSTGRQLAYQAPAAWRWHGRSVKIVDGTGVSMPDTPDNRKAYPPPRQNQQDSVGFPVLRLVVVFSLAVGTVLAAALGRFRGKGGSELALFRSLDDVLEPGDVLLADRLYATYWEVARAVRQGIDVVMRQHAGRTPVWFRGRGHSKGNRRVWWHKPPQPEWLTRAEYERLPDKLCLRALRVDVRQRGFRSQQLVLITTLTDADAYPAADLAELYRRRWQAELYLRSLKQTLGMDVVRGQTPEMVRKEVWAHLLVYNLVRLALAEAAEVAAVRPDELSFSGAWQTVNAFLPHLRTARTEAEREELWRQLVVAIGRHRVGQRPNRIEPRAVKRRAKNYPKLKGTRAEARRRLRQGVKRSGKKR
jgi:hypothetical protein